MDIGKIALGLRQSLKKNKAKQFLEEHASEIELSLEEYMRIPEDTKLHALHDSYRTVSSTNRLSGFPEDDHRREAYLRHYDQFINEFSHKQPKTEKEVTLAIDAYAKSTFEKQERKNKK